LIRCFACLLFVGGFLLPSAHAALRLNDVTNWAVLLDYDASRVYYTPEQLAVYDMVILDPDAHPKFDQADSPRWRVAYVSVGEAEEYRAYWKKVKDAAWLKGENSHWKANHRVDMRSAQWKDILIKEVIPAAIAAGFNGVMLDTIDTASYLEDTGGADAKGMREAAVTLVHDIRAAFPDLAILVNTTDAILLDLVTYIDGIVTEDICMMPDLAKGTYAHTPQETSADMLKNVLPARDKVRCPVFSIEYLKADDERNKSFCRKKAKRFGLRVYFAETGLKEFYRQ
jgi:uncharacterized protein (TIGR01370 family)